MTSVARVELYHGCAISFRARHAYTLARFVRLLGDGRAWIVIFEAMPSGSGWRAIPEIVDKDCIRVSLTNTEPPPLPDYLRGPECPHCGSWPLDMRGRLLWYCNSCMEDVCER